MLILVPLLLAAAFVAPVPSGARLYATTCESCHGAGGSGTKDGPPLRGVGAATLDFFLSTGRMPAAVPWIEVGHRSAATGQQLPLAQIRDLETYLAPVVAGGPALPQVEEGNVAHGRAVYESNCQQCHAVGGVGGSLGESDWAPSLESATINEIADAVRAGPDEMPRFSTAQLSQRDLDDVAAYVLQLPSEGGSVAPFRSTGPVPEGAVGYIAIIVLVCFTFVLWRNDTPPEHREEAVRRDEKPR